MADSDEEYERRRGRDKFRRERSDYQERREERNRREDWSERDRGSRREYREYDPRSRRDRYSPARQLSPPMKRMRRDWDDRGYGGYDLGYPGGGGGGGMMGGPPGGWGGGITPELGLMHGQHGFGGPQGPQRDVEPGLTQPPMMTFKQFLVSQDDGIDDQEAVKKYGEYKLEFKRQQINEFFLNHKEEEWFKAKFHPEECGKRKAEQHAALKKRLDAFTDLLDRSWIDAVSIDVEKSDQIVRLLDAVVIKLEGGSDNDLKVLDETYEEEKPKESEPLFVPPAKEEEEEEEEDDGPKKEKEPTEEESEEKKSEPLELPMSPEQEELQRKAKEYLERTKVSEKNDDKKRKRSRDYSYDENEEESSAESDSESEPAPPGIEEEGEAENSVEDTSNDVKKRNKKTNRDSEPRSDQEDNVENEQQSKNFSEKDEEEEEEEGEEEEERGSEEAHKKDEEEADNDKLEKEEKKVEEQSEKESTTEDSSKPRPLHKACSIFLRNLAPTITKQEVEAMCKRYPGFMRVAIADPQIERRFLRRGWVTFERTVNIKEICWNLNNIRLRDSELGAIVNRDLSRRIRSVNGIASHKQVVRSDIKLAARVIQNLDKQRSLWISEDLNDEPDDQGFLLVSQNPLLKNITDYLIEEASAEEEELLGMSEQEENREDGDGATLEKDEVLIKVLDRILLYLRIVHSIDYYNHSEYPNEDEMPNRCGIMHARGSPPTSKVTQHEINDYVHHFEQKISPFLQPHVKLSEEEAIKLGKKDPDVEVEKFVQANTQELAKDKWLCPLSGKKFKGPEFVRKHIFNKHGEKVDEVKKEVAYFNNYLVDPKRPQLPEHPSNRLSGGREMHGMGPFHGGFHPPPHYGGYGPRGPPGAPPFQGGFGSQGYGGRNNFDVYNRSGGFGKRNSYSRHLHSEPRKMVTYRDLDAPNDVDVF